MSPSTAQRSAPPGRARVDLRQLPWRWIGAVAAVVLSFAVVQRLTVEPSFVTLRITNPTPYALFVEASAASRDGWTSVAIALPHTATVAEEVIDEGSTWTFRFSSQGQSGGALTVTGAQLARAGWQVQIPRAVETQLERRGAPPTP